MNKLFFLLLLVLLSACTKNLDRFAAFNHQSEEGIFSRAEHALAKGDATEAIKNFEALEAQFPFGVHTEQAKLDMIYAYYQHEDLPLALEAAKRFMHLYPASSHLDYAYYMQGVAHFETGWHWAQRRFPYQRAQHDLASFEEAFASFDRLIRLFPHSQYRADAQKRMIYIRNMLAQHELDIAKFYWKKKAYTAAKEHALFIIETYQGAPQVREALALYGK